MNEPTAIADPILAEAIAACLRAKAIKGEPDLLPSPHWAQVLDRFHARALGSSRDCRELIAFATRNNGFVIYRLVTDPRTLEVAGGYLDWLQANGTPLSSLPIEIQESELTAPEVVISIQGRRISTSFLWHLCSAIRLSQSIPQLASMVEVGPGFGGLTRILKLLNPSIRFCLVDLPESLTFTYVYLKTSFPESRIMFVDRAINIDNELLAGYDFVLVPTNLLDCIRDLSCSVAVNVASLGEVSEASVGRYIRFFESDLKADYLYSINQYGQHPDESGRGRRLPAMDVCRVALPAGPDWTGMLWHHTEPGGFAHVDPLMAPCLEVLLKRGASDDVVAEAARLAEDAKAFPIGSAEWHGRLWNACRLDPRGEGARTLGRWAIDRGYPEFT